MMSTPVFITNGLNFAGLCSRLLQIQGVSVLGGAE